MMNARKLPRQPIHFNSEKDFRVATRARECEIPRDQTARCAKYNGPHQLANGNVKNSQKNMETAATERRAAKPATIRTGLSYAAATRINEEAPERTNGIDIITMFKV